VRIQRVLYNNFTLPNPRVAAQESPVLDEQGSQIGTSFQFTVSGVLTAASVTDFKALLATAECKLNDPRHNFEVDWSDDGGSTWEKYLGIESTNDDIEFGPKPGPLVIDRFAGGLAANYTWTISAVVKHCYGNDCSLVGRPSEILSIVRRWTHAVDESGYTTRTVSGKLLVTSASVLAGRSADSFRAFVRPALPVNFHRASEVFEEGDDGRELSFSFTDVEDHWTRPPPLTGGSGASFEVRVPDPLGGDRRFMIQYVLSGTFKGTAATGKGALIAEVGKLVTQKFGIGSGVVIPGAWSIAEEVYGNSIGFHVTAWRPFGVLPDGNPDFANIPGLSTMGQTPPGSDGQAQWIGEYGGDGQNVTSGVVAPPRQIYDACHPVYKTGGGTISASSTPLFTNVTPTSPGETAPDGTPGGVSDTHLVNPFIFVHEQVSYVLDNRIVVLRPKVKGKGPVVQRVGDPSLTVIHAGYRKQLARNAGEVKAPPPPPLLAAGKAVLRTADVTPATPDPAGIGAWNTYTVRFRYVVEYIVPLKTKNLSDFPGMVAFPQDPSRPDQGDADRALKMPDDLGIQ
jgi:hypothetical protein